MSPYSFQIQYKGEIVNSLKSNWCQKSLVAVLLGSFLLTSVGCNEEDVIAGAIIGGVIGGVLSDSDYDHHHRHRPGHSHRKHDDHRRKHRGHKGHKGHKGHGRHNEFALMAGDMGEMSFSSNPFATQQNTQTSNINFFAEKYDIKVSAAANFVDLMKLAKNGNSAAIEKLGIPLNEFQKLGNNELPHQVYINQMGFNLGIAASKAKVILTDMMEEADYQFSDFLSPVWSQCLAAGTWRTPENVSCSSANTKGCSPMTGASKCIPAL